MGVDFMTPMEEARRRLGTVPVQGNLDPTVLLAGRSVIEQKTRCLLEQVDRKGHIFNLGHGILPQTPVEDAVFLVDLVHSLTIRGEERVA